MNFNKHYILCYLIGYKWRLCYVMWLIIVSLNWGKALNRSSFACICIELMSIKATSKALIKPPLVFILHDLHAVVMKSELPVIIYNSNLGKPSLNEGCGWSNRLLTSWMSSDVELVAQDHSLKTPERHQKCVSDSINYYPNKYYLIDKCTILYSTDLPTQL